MNLSDCQMPSAECRLEDAGNRKSQTKNRQSPSGPWLELDEAARRSAKTEGHLRRLCRDKWLAANLARLVSGDGTKPRWQVHESADPALARVKFAESIGTDLRQVPQAKRDEALRRKKILDDWFTARRGGLALGFCEGQITSQFLSHHEAETGEHLGRRTLYLWDSKWRKGGLLGLVDRRGSLAPGPSPLAPDPFLEEIKRLYLTTRRLKLTVCHEVACTKAAERGWTVRGYKTCQRAIDQIPRAVLLKMRFGEEAFVNEAEPFIDRDYTTLASNELWNADHHQFDVTVTHEGQFIRPWLTMFQDVRSRKLLAWGVYANSPNSDSIFAVIRKAIAEHGVPQKLLIDNGKDFDCAALNGRTKKDRWAKRTVRIELPEKRAAGLFAGLGIETIHALPYHGQSKPVERWFGWLESRTPVWETYCGNAPQNRPQDLQLQLERGKAPTLAEFAAWFDELVGKYNASHEHGGQGMDGQAPDQVYAECLGAKRTAPAELLDLLCLEEFGPVKVGQNGVTWNKLKYGKRSLELQRLLGREVMLRVDRQAIGQVHVFDTAGKFVCLAAANEALPFLADSQALREAMREKRSDAKAMTAYFDTRARMADDLPERILRIAAEKATKSQPGGNDVPPPSIQPVRHALEGELPAIRAAVETQQKKAVGAESMTPSRERFIYPKQQQPAEEDSTGGERFVYPRRTTDQ